MILPICNLFFTFEQLLWVLISVIWIRRHGLDHPVTKLGHQLEIRALDVSELGNRLRLLIVVGEGFEDLSASREVAHDVICVTCKLHSVILVIKLI